MDSPKKHKQVSVTLVVSGQVQGVFYRAWTQQTAQDLGLKGWVRNREDGAVELIAQGLREDLEALIEKCWEGPSAAQVTDIQCHWGEAQRDLEPFCIQH